ncbi:Symplekin tight junction protein C terminal-domain-containing protein [Geranomyces variabilis]|nr:Symplekin tight junction protein C terminal-domain-containing protein [Geranomyces variabilis]KAJ3136888.1 hypothetical protein HDU90_002454 [Geranomyces variabilis]
MTEPAASQALLLLNAARTVADSEKRVAVLHQLHELMKREPTLLPAFFPHALGLAVDPQPDLRIGLTRLIEDTICRMSVPDDVKLLVSARSVEALSFLMADGNPGVLKRVIRCSTSIYPFVFKWLCRLPTDPSVWQGVAALKVKIFAVLGHANDGVKESTLRFLHKLLIIQSPRDASVPAIGTDSVSVDFVPANHPFINPRELVAESAGLSSRLLTYLASPGISAGPICANINCLVALCRTRPQYLQQLLTALIQWPTLAPPMPSIQRKSVERTIKIALMTALKSPSSAPFTEILVQALTLLGAKPHEIQHARRRDLKRSSGSSSRTDFKRVKVETPTEQRSRTGTPQPEPREPIDLSSFDITTLPANLVTELVVITIGQCEQSRWEQGLELFRKATGVGSSNSRPLQAQDDLRSVPDSTSVVKPEGQIHSSTHTKEEDREGEIRIDPMAISQFDDTETDIYTAQQPPPQKPTQLPQPPVKNDEELDAEVLDESAAGATLAGESDTTDLELTPAQRKSQVLAAVRRILELESSFGIPASTGAAPVEDAVGFQSLPAARSGWMQVLSRLTTAANSSLGGILQRDTEEETELKSLVVNALLDDFRNRHELAITWLLHLWIEDEEKTRLTGSAEESSVPSKEYRKWFHLILEALGTRLEPKDKTFTKFLIDVPEVTTEAIETVVRKHCDSEDRMQLGLFTLQGLINLRPAVRDQCLQMLMDYALSPIKLTRATAIVMCKRFLGENRDVGSRIEQFALECINKLRGPPPPPPSLPAEEKEIPSDAIPDVAFPEASVPGAPNGSESTAADVTMDVNGADERENDSKPSAPTANEEWQELDVIRHLELYFALCSKSNDLLIEIFQLYKDLAPGVQSAVRTSIQPLIKALAAQPARLMPLIRAFPDGSDPLILQALIMMTERELPSAQLVALVRNVFTEKDLDARFLIPIISGLDRAEVLQYLSKIVLLLDGTEAQRKTVRDAFVRLVDSPSAKNAAASGAVTSSAVVSSVKRVLGGAGSPLAPSELLVALHHMEDVVGLKRAVEAINVCFSMQDVFKQEVLAVVLQQLVDQPKLPTLFMRTVIQSVNQYSGLVSFVANLLLKLINRKIWTFPKLWDGFIRCCTIMFPTSIQVLQSLPKAQAVDVLKRSAKLKASVVDHLSKLDPERRSRRDMMLLATLVFGDAPENQNDGAGAVEPSSPHGPLEPAPTATLLKEESVA